MKRFVKKEEIYRDRIITVYLEEDNTGTAGRVILAVGDDTMKFHLKIDISKFILEIAKEVNIVVDKLNNLS